MATININKIITINNGVIGAGGAGFSLIGMTITTNQYIPSSSRYLNFTSASDVGNYFGIGSDEYAGAVVYFAGSSTKQQTPKSLSFARYYQTATQGQILGKRKNPTTVAQFQLITAGAITVSTTAHPSIVVTTIDLHTATSLSMVASLLTTAINASQAGAVNVVYDATLQGFIMTDTVDTAGADSIISVNTTALTTALGLAAASGATLSNGQDEETITQCLNDIVSNTRNWISLLDLVGFSDDEVLEATSWITLQASTDDQYVYNMATNDPDVLVIGNTTNIVYKVIQANTENVIMMFGGNDLAFFVAGVGAGTNYDLLNGTLSFAFKQQAGLTATITKDSDADLLDSLGVNYYGAFSSRSNPYTIFYTGVITGSYKTIANVYNNAWLSDKFQNSLMNLFLVLNKVIYTNKGYTQLRATLQADVISATNNGTIASGQALSATQQLELQEEAGVAIADQITNSGYYIQVVPATPIQIQNQLPPNVNIWYANGGEIIKVTINNRLVA